MRVGFATSDWSQLPDESGQPSFGGSGWYRAGVPAAELARRGHDVVVGTLLAHNRADELGVRSWDETHHWDFDVVVLQRWMYEDLPGRVRRAVASGQRVVNDVDDWFFGLATSNRAFQATHPRLNPESNLNHYRGVLAASSFVTVSTEYLAGRLRSLTGGRVKTVRNSIDLGRWHAKTPTDRSPVVGWVGATPWRSGDLETLRGVVGPFCDSRGLTFHHAGHVEGRPSAGEVLGVRSHTEELMVPIHEYPRLFQGVDVGIVPLADRPFNEAKSAIKGMEYAASGVPFVAADTAEYRWLADKGCGRVARRPREWLRHLDELTDPGVLAEEAAKNSAAVAPLDSSLAGEEWEQALLSGLEVA